MKPIAPKPLFLFIFLRNVLSLAQASIFAWGVLAVMTSASQAAYAQTQTQAQTPAQQKFIAAFDATTSHSTSPAKKPAPGTPCKSLNKKPAPIRHKAPTLQEQKQEPEYEVPGPDDNDPEEEACEMPLPQEIVSVPGAPMYSQYGYQDQVEAQVGAVALSTVIRAFENNLMGEWVTDCVPQGVLGPSLLAPSAMNRQQGTYYFGDDGQGNRFVKMVIEEFPDTECQTAVTAPITKQGTWRIRRPVPEFPNVAEMVVDYDYCSGAFCQINNPNYQLYASKVQLVLVQPYRINFGVQLPSGDIHWFFTEPLHRPGTQPAAR